jgi:glycosyltransferase involved in cell wall biosynthesis
MKMDVVHYHALGPSALAWVPRIAGVRTVATVHGLDWRGGKWGAFASWLLRRCEYAACHFPTRTVVVSEILKAYFERKFGGEVTHIPNGVWIGDKREPKNLDRFGVTSKGYYLFVGRFGPEKGCHVLIEAFMKADTSKQLVMVGSPHLNLAYGERLRSMANESVIFTGAVYGDLLTELWNGAYAVIHPSITEGMSLSLLEAMAHSRCVIVSDIPENTEVVADAALRFKAGDVGELAQVISNVDRDPQLVETYGLKALNRVKEAFSWTSIVDRLEQTYGGA